MRGKPREGDAAHPAARFIPAHAGKTGSGAGRRPRRPVHPRACGENDEAADALYEVLGSSPRMRGKLVALSYSGMLGRFIPAHAGKTVQVPHISLLVQVHPRACGENSCESRMVSWVGGSSPRMRGKPCRRGRHDRGTGFIPAHAGKTLSDHGRVPSSLVHPRACGENQGLCRKVP